MDANGDAKVDADEFYNNIDMIATTLETEEQFAAFLADSFNISVTTSLDEATGEVTVTAQSGFDSRAEILDVAFKALDADGSGQIDKEEFKAAVARMVSPVLASVPWGAVLLCPAGPLLREGSRPTGGHGYPQSHTHSHTHTVSLSQSLSLTHTPCLYPAQFLTYLLSLLVLCSLRRRRSTPRPSARRRRA